MLFHLSARCRHRENTFFVSIDNSSLANWQGNKAYVQWYVRLWFTSIKIDQSSIYFWWRVRFLCRNVSYSVNISLYQTTFIQESLWGPDQQLMVAQQLYMAIVILLTIKPETGRYTQHSPSLVLEWKHVRAVKHFKFSMKYFNMYVKL